MRGRYKWYFKILILVLLFSSFCLWQNNHIIVSKYEFIHEKVSKNLDGYRIVQVSDLHNKDFGNQLIKKARKESPDMIVITGDLIDSRRTNTEVAISFAKDAVLIAPVYYVTGNHEASTVEYEVLAKGLRESGVIILDNTFVNIKHNNVSFNLIGIDDPLFTKELDYNYLESINPSNEVIKKLENYKDDLELNILLSHRPELIYGYKEAGMELVLTGHAHGGQMRLPFIGGLVAPNQGIFPRYTSRIHSLGDTSMVISRGLGNSIIPLRIFNRPELVVVVLRNETK